MAKSSLVPKSIASLVEPGETGLPEEGLGRLRSASSSPFPISESLVCTRKRESTCFCQLKVPSNAQKQRYTKGLFEHPDLTAQGLRGEM